jgi:uncharacterized PurR-regulated membrane protein YhhQ (DUF165 family)
VDSILFYPIAFVGVWSNQLLISVLVSSYLFKVIWEVVVTPFTYLVVNWLKRVEHEDYYDYNTDFNPFTLKFDRLM